MTETIRRDIAKKAVLGTVQLGMEYGISNTKGKPSREESLNILSAAWKEGIRWFDTAPSYGTEDLLGDFIGAHGLGDQVNISTKISSLQGEVNKKEAILKSIDESVKRLNVPNIDVLFFHAPKDSLLLLEYPRFFEKLLADMPVNAIGVSVYEPKETDRIQVAGFDLAFQFPLNLLDRRFEYMRSYRGKRFARSVLLQGILASEEGLRPDSPNELKKLYKEYYSLLNQRGIRPYDYAIEFILSSDSTDYFLIGVETEKQLRRLFSIETVEANLDKELNELILKHRTWLDPRKWISDAH